MKYHSLLSLLALFLCSICQAGLSKDLETKLNLALSSYSSEKPIECQADQQEALRSAIVQIQTKIFSLGLGNELGMWVKVLTHVLGKPTTPMDKPVREKGEEDKKFKERKEKYRDSEELRKDLLQYFHSKFPIQEKRASSCSHSTSSVSSQAESLASDLALEIKGSTFEEEIGRAPHLTGAMLFVELSGEPKHEGWDLHMEALQTLRGAAGHVNVRGQEVPAGDSSADQTMVALADPVLGQLPLYLVNKNPVTLTDSKESQEFFKDLPIELKKKTDGTYVGHRYVFFRDAFINTERYSGPDARKPFSIYLMKKVKSQIGREHELTPQDQKKFEKAIKNEMASHDLLQGALKLKNSEAEGPQVRKREQERARELMKLLAKEGFARAQYELAIMYRDAVGGEQDLKKGKKYAALALSQGLPVISFEVPKDPNQGKVGRSTKTGAFYELIANHPLLGRAWKDPRGLIRRDGAERDANGQILRMTQRQAFNHCITLNPPNKREAVKQKLKEREDLLTPLREEYYDTPLYQRTEEAAKAMRDASYRFGPIPGCYLESREEQEEFRIDLGYSSRRSQYSHEILSDLNYWFWSSSGSPYSDGYAFTSDGDVGYVGVSSRGDNGKAARCLCGVAAAE